MEYIRLCNDVVDRGRLIPKEEIHNHLESNDISYYRSLFFYNESQFKTFKEKGSIAGIKDVVGNYIVFDFDNESDIEPSRHDALELCTRLISYGLTETDFNIYFSGNKGYSVEFYTTDRLTPQEFKNLTGKLSEGLKTRDEKIVNASRVFRVPLTRHPKSGLYKLSLTFNQLGELNSEQIKELATSVDNAATYTEKELILPKALKDLTKAEYKVESEYNPALGALDLSRKPRNMPACKFAIMHGFIKPGTTHDSLMALGAHFKSIGYPKEATYRILKAAVELQERRYPERDGQAPKDSIWKITDEVYEKLTDGGTYSCKSHDFLKKNCPTLNSPDCKANLQSDGIVGVGQLATKFKEFAKNIEKNKIYTGIAPLDRSIILTTSMPIGILGAPGSGKTSLILDILNHTSNAGVHSLFCSLDMGWPLVYAKLISRLSGESFESVLDAYKRDNSIYNKWDKEIAEQFKNVGITFKSGTTIDDIRELALSYQERTGQKVKLIVIDYLECLAGPYSDPTANGAFQAAKIKDLATDLETCVAVLVQPPKSAGDASKPLTSMRQVKGASTLEQNFRAIISIHREGFSPEAPHLDKFITINGLKNTMGPLFSLDLLWNGVRGKVSELNPEQKWELEKLREEKLKKDKVNKSDDWG